MDTTQAELPSPFRGRQELREGRPGEQVIHLDTEHAAGRTRAS